MAEKLKLWKTRTVVHHAADHSCIGKGKGKDKGKGKGKAISLQAWTGPDGSRKRRLPEFKTMCPGRFYLQEIFWYSFLLEAESTPGP
jgi:hypothetical protein